MNFNNIKDTHPGEKCIVLGCGPSIQDFKDYRGQLFTIGVNDIGQFCNPDVLVVLDNHKRFTKERQEIIESTNPDIFAYFTDDWNKSWKNKVSLPLGSNDVTKIQEEYEKGKLAISCTSTFVAIELVYYMGFRQIGMLGVDFTKDHYNRQDGVHKLNQRLDKINTAYQELEKFVGRDGMLVNLSQESNVEITKMSLEEFLKI